jgi:hypothetical protein
MSGGVALFLTAPKTGEIASNIRLTITAEQRLLQKSKIEQP